MPPFLYLKRRYILEKIAIIDLDAPKYSVASIGEERYITVTHNPTGRVKEFKNITQFYGKNTKGGWLKDKNLEREERGLEPFPVEDFTIVHGQRVSEPLENILYSAKRMVEAPLKQTGTDSYEAYIGKGDPFRVELSKMMKYKGGREDLLKPLLLDDVAEYLKKKFNGVVIQDLEVDDYAVIRCVELLEQGKDAFIVGSDKDYMGCPVKFFNINKPEEGIRDCRGFGELWLDESGSQKKVRGYGRLFKYFQIGSGDVTDSYKANSQSKIKWADMGSYKVLKDCKTDKEAWQVLVNIYKKLYPEPVTFTTWKDEEVTMDFLDCLQEITDMAHLREYKDDRIIVKEELDKSGIDPYSDQEQQDK